MFKKDHDRLYAHLSSGYTFHLSFHVTVNTLFSHLSALLLKFSVPRKGFPSCTVKNIFIPPSEIA
jgi:hypothetical protein